MANNDAVGFENYYRKSYEEFLKDRNLFLVDEINQKTAMDLMVSFLLLEKEDPDSPINLYIDSPGGSIQSGLTIIDTMNHIHPPVYTICYGYAASMASVVLCSGEKGHRYALEHSTIMIHQPSVNLSGYQKQSEVAIEHERLLAVRKQVEEIIAKQTEKEIEDIRQACEYDHFMSSLQAKEFGLIDEILQ